MSQQPHDLGFLSYAAPPVNRSPNASRPHYGGAVAFGAGMTLPRQSQRPFDSTMASSTLYPTDRAAAGFNPRTLDSMAVSGGGLPGAFMLDNGQPWNHPALGIATVNGAMHGNSRQRNVNRRAALPPTWTEQAALQQAPHALQHFGLNGTSMANGGLRVDQNHAHTSPDLRSTASDGDQLIPTAIVIKNIPFAVRKETLASIMLELNLPQPYAFNYHFDNGVFRGLAFANFQSADDTRVVIEAMNGMDVHGRKLRVEYKKMLPEAERERIEREKRERRGQLEEQHRGPMLHQQSSMQSLASATHAQQRSPSGHLGDVNMNDPQTLGFYTELIMFKRDDSREILIFPPSIAPEHRRSIHILAHNMGLEHQSIGDADARQLTVLKRQQPSPTASIPNAAAVPLDLHKRGLSRAATFDFAVDRDSRAASSSYTHLLGRQNPTLELPGSPEGNGIANNLRAAKSFADLRSFTPSPSQASSTYLAAGSAMNALGPANAARFGDYVTGVQPSHPGSSTTPAPKNENGLIAGLASLSLSPYDAHGVNSQARSTPGAIGSQRPGASNSTAQSAPERQPRASEWDTSAAGYVPRTRNDAHAQRENGPSTPLSPAERFDFALTTGIH